MASCRPAVVVALLALAIAVVGGSTSQAAATHTARVQNGHIVVDGKPFFPIMQWLQCPSLFEHNASLGVDVFLGKGCARTTDVAELQAVGAAHAFSVLPTPGAATGSSLLGWHFEDEPDLKSIQPSQIASEYKANKKRNPNLLSFLTVTAGFFSKRFPPSWMNGSREPYLA